MIGKAVVFTEKLKVAYQDVSIPTLQDDEIMIDIEHSWISNGTESSFLRGERTDGETPFRDGDPLPFPQVAGYQKVGRITLMGNNVQGFAIGDRVFATISKVNNMFFSTGGHVSPAVTHESQVWKLPAEIDPIAYSGLVLTQVGYNCGICPPVKAGDYAIVIGDGMVGQWAAQTLLHRGAHVIVLGRHDDRLALLPEAITRANVKTSSIQEAVQAVAGKFSIIVDTVGSLTTVTELISLAQSGCHLVSAGFLGEDGRIDIQMLRTKNVTLHCPSGWNQQAMDETLQGITEGWLQTTSLVTHRFPVEHAKKAWDLILDPKQTKLGVILDWI
ncbi:oxidoreductase [Paenibacillus baekrokdamisoli]|uniref:Oxidoreductase n=1 Tax=Paenibacillus baekrokdamisoli TaxID=1712516 RepID=A0A3G9JGL4_9BACL|nr:zinc-binding dehydrogenase [Paenibacillus baekrokdamisoli]MBB3070932.1 2-desacetyl-2-hydroxyethyl bacteriochlorophyllide A dehydrogenase [Paenibacillus baekrokdamisoli]BBH22129.1 oxidoreductase [Paenibacillus baekrokdamisoli]